MSNTRKAVPGKPMRQERFSSSAEFKRGLMANLVARRCELIESEGDRALIWFLQYLSHREGGLKVVAENFVEKFADRIGTASMRRFGMRPGQIYDAAKVRAVRSEMPLNLRCHFLLAGERDILDIATPSELAGADAERLIADSALEQLHGYSDVQTTQPKQYPAQDFVDECRVNLSPTSIETIFQEMCLNPEVPLCGDWPWWFSELTNCLREFMADWIAAQAASTVTTEIGALVHEELEYAVETKCLVLIDGAPRIGKTVAVKAWCAQYPGRVRYAQVPSTNDEIGFYRAIAKSLGVSINLNSKAAELRQRIEETLQTGQLALVLDEAHYLWPNLIDPRTIPARVNWILTALVNYNVPVALVTTPQFIKTQKMVEAQTRWTSEQFMGRIGHYLPLPDCLSESDLKKVAVALLPEGDDDSIAILVSHAQASLKYLASIECIVRRARYLAAKQGRSETRLADIRCATRESVMPSDRALAKAMATVPKGRAQTRLNRAELTADYSAVNMRKDAAQSPILPDQESGESAERNRIEMRDERSVLVTG